ncbi:MAG: hypothetical protein ABIQ40_02720, partial [Bacteroidia bacterium]
GAQGIAGATGANGATGVAGPTGANGATGTAGTNGVTGATGLTGANGATGPNGATGAVGPTGANGATGTAGTNGVTGATGLTGPNGATGAAGPTGANGVTGTAGTNGATGATGVTGANGATGTNGTNGATGAAGPTGANGVTGTAGTNGVTGSTGPSGANGAAGPTGANGVTGTAGTNGVTGPTGPSGANGAVGPTGANGVTGTNGATGATGPLVTGTTGQTLYHDGTTFVATSNLYNDGLNVGVNIIPSQAKFEVAGALFNTVGMFGTGNKGISLMYLDARLGFNMYEGAAGNLYSMGAGRTALIALNSTADALTFSVSNGITGSPSTSVTMTERMRIVAASGYVGIGTNNPTRKLHIVESTTLNQPLAQFEYTTTVSSSASPNAALFGDAAGSGTGNIQGGYFIGRTTSASANTMGVYGEAKGSSFRNSGVYGHVPTSGGVGASIGVEGLAESTNSSNNYGIYGSGVAATSGSISAYGIFASATNGTNSNATSYGIYSSAPGSFGTRWSGWFEEGNFYVKNVAGFGTSIIPGNTQIAVNTGVTAFYQFRLLTTVTGNTATDGFAFGQANGGGEMIFNQYENNNVYFQYQNANMILYNGVGVGIKTSSSPTQALEVGGNVEIPAANTYRYATPKTQYSNIPASEFNYAVVGNSTTSYVESFVSGTAVWVRGNGSTAASMFAPVHLPHGAVITIMEVFCWDNDATYNVSVDLMRQIAGSSTATLLASTGSTSGASAAVQTLSLAPSVTIDNAAYNYYLRFNTIEAANNNLRIYGIRFTYTVTSTD